MKSSNRTHSLHFHQTMKSKRPSRLASQSVSSSNISAQGGAKRTLSPPYKNLNSNIYKRVEPETSTTIGTKSRLGKQKSNIDKSLVQIDKSKALNFSDIMRLKKQGYGKAPISAQKLKDLRTRLDDRVADLLDKEIKRLDL